MATEDLEVFVRQGTPATDSEGIYVPMKGNRRGETCVVDFLTEMALEGRVYQIRAGTASAPLTGDEAITDSGCEMFLETGVGVTALPIEVMITWNNLGGDALECAGKSVGTASTSGTAFVPINLLAGGISSRATAAVQSAGNALVAAETALTTRQHFHYSEEFVSDSDAESEPWTPVVWQPKLIPVMKDVAVFYVQIASATTGPGYFAHINFIELRTVNVT